MSNQARKRRRREERKRQVVSVIEAFGGEVREPVLADHLEWGHDRSLLTQTLHYLLQDRVVLERPAAGPRVWVLMHPENLAPRMA